MELLSKYEGELKMYNKELFAQARSKIADKPIVVIQQERLVKRIADLERELASARRELSLLEKKVLMSGIKELQQDADARHIKLTKKEAIIQYSLRNVPTQKIAETVEVSESYVRKVISLYRKEKGIKPISKGDRTRNQVFVNLENGLSVNEIATLMGITPQYVSQIKGEYDKKVSLGVVSG